MGSGGARDFGFFLGGGGALGRQSESWCEAAVSRWRGYRGRHWWRGGAPAPEAAGSTRRFGGSSRESRKQSGVAEPGGRIGRVGSACA